MNIAVLGTGKIVPTAIEAFQQIRKMAEAGQLPDLTLDEINEEISLAREERRLRK